MNARRLVAVALVGGLAVSCAADVPEDEPVEPLDALTWESDVDGELAGVPLAVGSPSHPVDELLGWIAVETIIDESVVREIIPQLKALGAEGIIEYPLNKVVY